MGFFQIIIGTAFFLSAIAVAGGLLELVYKRGNKMAGKMLIGGILAGILLSVLMSSVFETGSVTVQVVLFLAISLMLFGFLWITGAGR